MKKYVIFAGVSGAGKTTLYQTNEEYLDLPRENGCKIRKKCYNEVKERRNSTEKWYRINVSVFMDCVLSE